MSAQDRNDEKQELERQVARWMAREAPPLPPDMLLETVLTRTRTIPQRGGWAWTPGQPWHSTLLPGRIGIALVGLLLVAISGAAVVGSRVMGLPMPWQSPPALPSPGAGPPALTRLTDTAAFGNGSVSDVMAGGPGLIAVGSVSEGAHKVAAVWTSADGRTWTRVPTAAAFMDGFMSRVVQHGSTLVGLGFDCSPGSQYICGEARIWLSGDGQHWQTASATFGGPSMGGLISGFEAITVGGPGFVAVGGTDAADPYGGKPVGAGVATSADGSHWTTQAAASPQFAGASMGGVAAGRSGGLVAVGSGARLEPAVWTSADGLAWTRLPSTDTPSQGELDDIAAGPSGFVAVGRYGDHATSWTSHDGRAWRETPATPALADAAMTRVIWDGSAFLALGRSGGGDGLAWISSDGSSWTRLDTTGIFARAPVIAAGSIGSQLTLFGLDPEGRIVVATSAH